MKEKLLIAVAIFLQTPFFAQNIGIGTSDPSRAKLEVHGAVESTSAIFGGESTGISIQRNWPGIGFNSYYNTGSHRYMANGFGALQFLDPTSGVMAFDFFNAGTKDGLATGRRAIVISNDGWMNVGSAGFPTHTLTVARGTAAAGTAAFSGSVYQSVFNSGPEENTYIRAGKANGTVFINDLVSNGKVSLFGTVEVLQGNTPGFILKHIGTLENWRFGIYANGGTLGLHFNGELKGTYNSSSGSYSAVSDRRLKTEVRSLPDVMGNVLKLEPVVYEVTQNNRGHQKDIGLIAQDVKKIFPELVTVLKDSTGYDGITDLHTLNYSSLGVIAIKAIQEQQALIESQRQRIAILEEKLALVDKKLAGLSVPK